MFDQWYDNLTMFIIIYNSTNFKMCGQIHFFNSWLEIVPPLIAEQYNLNTMTLRIAAYFFLKNIFLS